MKIELKLIVYIHYSLRGIASIDLLANVMIDKCYQQLSHIQLLSGPHMGEGGAFEPN